MKILRIHHRRKSSPLSPDLEFMYFLANRKLPFEDRVHLYTKPWYKRLWRYFSK